METAFNRYDDIDMTMLVISGPPFPSGAIDVAQAHLAGQLGKFKIFETRSMAAMIVSRWGFYSGER